MSTAMTKAAPNAITPTQEQALQYRVALNANLFGMPDAEVYTYYKLMCQHLKLDPTSHPFDIINDAKASQKKLYLNSIGTSQLGDRAKLSYGKLDIDVNEKLVSLGFKVAHVSIEVRHPDGRSLVAEAFVDLMSGWEGKPLAGNNLINALKKAGTQCRRRGTLQMLGMMPQDAEVPTITLGSLERDDEYEGVTVEQPPDAALLTSASEDQIVNDELIGHFKSQKGEKNGQAFFDSVWAKKPFAEREAEAKRLGLTTSPALEVEQPAPAVADPATEPQYKASNGHAPDSMDIALIEVEELIRAAKDAPLNRTAKEVNDEIKRQMGHHDLSKMSLDGLTALKDGLTFYLKSLRK